MVSSWKGTEDGEDGAAAAANITEEISPRIMSPSQFAALQLFCAVLAIVLSALGTVTNAINIRVFGSMNLHDSVSVSFLGLSVSDFLTSISNGLWSLSMFFLSIELRVGLMYGIDPYNLRIMFATLADTFYTVTILTSLFIAVTRCACVMRPLQFRHVFTVKRSILVVAFCNVFAAACFLPVFALSRFEETFNTILNDTRIIMRFSESWRLSFRYGYIVSHTVVPVITQVTLFVCVLAMSWSLRTAMKFRQKSTAKQASAGDEAESGKLSDKELQVVRQVVLLSIIFMVCNLPQIVSKLVQAFVPDFRIGYTLWPETLFPFNRAMLQVNSSVNIFIYLKYNRKYYEYCSNNFPCGKKDEKA